MNIKDESLKEFLSAYFSFQENFNTIKEYDEFSDIITNFYENIISIIRERQELFKDVLLIYPSFFYPDFDNNRFFEIGNNSFVINTKNEELYKLISLHLLYYGNFPRLSEKLINGDIDLMSILITSKSTSIKINEASLPIEFKFNKNINILYDINIETLNNALSSHQTTIFDYYTNLDLPASTKFNDSIFKNIKSYLTTCYFESNELFELKNKTQQFSFDRTLDNIIYAHLQLTKQSKVAYVFSRTSQDSKSERKIGYGGIFLLLDNNVRGEKLNNIINFFHILCDTLSACVSFNISKKRLHLAQIKSAIAAIMARNMSHNLGSHVFYYVRNEIACMADKPNEDSVVSSYKGLAKFLQYVQERQDFVATITSQDEYFFGPLNLKSDVLDEITPDAVDIRHNSEPPSKNFILKYLVNSESIGRKDRFTDESSIKEIELEIILNNKVFRSKDKTKVSVEFYDTILAVQGGQQSRHAFLIILENIIRNAAKHGFDKENSDELIIKINVKKIGGDYEFIISDNCANANYSISKITEYLESIKILGSFGEDSINRENKGLKEIIACIAWLKGLPLSNVFKPTSGIYDNILSIVNHDGNIGYCFRLPVFNKTVSIEKLDLISIKKNQTLLKKYGLIHLCDNEILFEAKKYFPRCIPNGIENYWEYLAQYKCDIDQVSNFPVVIFERASYKPNEGKFYFTPDEDSLRNLIRNLGKNKFILFKNHLTKSENSLQKYFEETEDEIFNGNNPIFVENLSGSTYSFSLFQIAQIEHKCQELYYRIIEAFYTKIVIVDERICTINVSYIDDLLNLIKNPFQVNSFVEKYFNNSHKDFEEEILTILKLKDNSKENLLSFWNSVEPSAKYKIIQSHSMNYKKRYLEQRFIYLFTMEKDGAIFDQDGIQCNSLRSIKPHFFSIHIGLLDKLTEFDNAKETTTREKLAKVKEKLNIPDTCYIAVHSGRGGLTDKNKDITFIPFANLQWCLENSKYMLSELFHSQIYFPI